VSVSNFSIINFVLLARRLARWVMV